MRGIFFLTLHFSLCLRRVFWALRKFILLERKAIREDVDCFREMQSFRTELSSGSDQTKGFASFLEKYLLEEDQSPPVSASPQERRKVRRKSEPPKLDIAPPATLPSKASQLLGLGASSSQPIPTDSPSNPRRSGSFATPQESSPVLPSKATTLLGLSQSPNAFESAGARPNSIAAMAEERGPISPTKERRRSRGGSAESTQSEPSAFYDGSLILSCDPEDIAEQLMYIDFELFRRTQINEYCCSSFSKESPKANSVAALVEQANRLSRWIATAVLNPRIDRATRAKILSKLITLLDCLKARNNFASLVTVFSTLESHAISRLKKTWKLVKKAKREIVKRYGDLIKPMSNFSGYRELLNQAELPCVPYIGITTKDMVSIEELPTYVSPPGSTRSSVSLSTSESTADADVVTPTSTGGEAMPAGDSATKSDSGKSLLVQIAAAVVPSTPRSAERCVNWAKMQMISRVLNNQVVKFRTGTFYPSCQRPEIFAELNFLENDALVAKLVHHDDFNKLSDEIEPRASDSPTLPSSPVPAGASSATSEPVLSFLAKRKADATATTRRQSSGSLTLSFTEPTISGDSDGESDDSAGSAESASSTGSQKSVKSRISTRRTELPPRKVGSQVHFSEDSGELQTNRAIAKQLTNVLYTISNTSSVHNRMKTHPWFFQLRPSSLCLSTLHTVLNMDSSRALSPRSAPLSQINLPALFASLMSITLEDSSVCCIVDHSIPKTSSDSLQAGSSSRSKTVPPGLSSSSSALFPGLRSIHLERRSLSMIDSGAHMLVGAEQHLVIALTYFAMACRAAITSGTPLSPAGPPNSSLHLYVRDDDDDEEGDSDSGDEISSGDDHSASLSPSRTARVRLSVSEGPISSSSRAKRAEASLDDIAEHDDFLDDDLDDLLLSTSEAKPMYIPVPAAASSIMKHCERYLPSLKIKLTCQRFFPAERDSDSPSSKPHLILNMSFSAGWWAPIASAHNVASPSSFTLVSASRSSSGSNSRRGSTSKRDDGKDKKDKSSRHGSRSSHRRPLHSSAGAESIHAPGSQSAEFAGAFVTNISLESIPPPSGPVGGESSPRLSDSAPSVSISSTTSEI